MIVRTRYSGDVSVRSTWPDRTFPPSRSQAFTASGQVVTTETAVGLPALGRAIRLVAGTAASLCLEVYRGEYADKLEVEDYPAGLFDRPAEGMSTFDWIYDIFASLEAAENAVILKLKSKGQVTELHPIPIDLVRITVDRKTQEKRFDIVGATGQITTLTANDVLHIRGHTPYGGQVGVSRIWQHRDPAGAMLAAQKFEGAFFRNHARPDLAVIFPQGVNREQAKQWREEWAANYGGPDNAGQPVPFGGGVTVQPIPVSMNDAQFLESKRLSVEELGRIMDVHPILLGDLTNLRPGVESEALDHFLAVQFRPRLRRVEAAFRADTDLFTADTDLYPEFKLTALMFANALTAAEVQHQQIQDGTLLADEARADMGRPPLPDGVGMIPQITPVGGAPNPAPTVITPQAPVDQARGLTIPSLELRLEQDMEPLAREMGLAFSNMADALGKFTTLTADLQERAALVDRQREKREIERVQAQAKRDDAQADAFRAMTQPQVIVNIEPTPVTVENILPELPIQLTLVDDQPTSLSVDFQRNPNGTLKSATVTED